MMKSTFLGTALGLAVAAMTPATAQVTDAEFEAFHKSLLTLDTHTDVNPAKVGDPGILGDNQVDLVKMEKGGLDAVFFIAYAQQRDLTPEGLDQARLQALSRLFTIKKMVERYPDRIGFARTADDVVRIASSGKLVALLGVENGFPVGESLEWVHLFHDAGARYMGITHFGHNQLGDSSNPNPDLGDEAERHGGLSDFGREMVGELNQLGIIPDVSHAAMTTTIEAARLSKAPIMASHSGVRGIADVDRNLSDEALLAIRDNGGVAQMVALSAYVKADPERDEKLDALRAEFNVDGTSDIEALPEDQRAAYQAVLAQINEDHPLATVADFVDHIDYAVKLAGIDHVGISSDFDGGGGVMGWQNAAETPNVTAELLSRGYSASDIQKLWGGNILRIMREAEQIAADLSAQTDAPDTE